MFSNNLLNAVFDVVLLFINIYEPISKLKLVIDPTIFYLYSFVLIYNLRHAKCNKLFFRN